MTIVSGGRTAAAATPALSAQPDSEVRGLTVEEVAFTSLSQSTTVRAGDYSAPETPATEIMGIVSDRSDARLPERGDSDIRSQSDASGIHKPSDPTIQVTTVNLADIESSAERDLPSTEIETHVFDHPRVVISAPPGLVYEQTAAPAQVVESFSAIEFRNATSATEFDFGDQGRETTPDEEDPGRYSRSTEQRRSGLAERVERQLIVQNYLKEISEWISTPVATEEESASLIADVSGASNSDLRRRADQSRTAAPEQQDLTLSIGTIKIVVEEPRAQPAPPPAPLANTEPAFERATTAPTDLSRYYINRC
jgi:hypothetical protein